jgi:hypothetical protein
MSEYEPTKRYYNPNRSGPKNSCDKGHPYHILKRRKKGTKPYEVRVTCECYTPKRNEVVWYHNLDQAILQHFFKIRNKERREPVLDENLFNNV